MIDCFIVLRYAAPPCLLVTRAFMARAQFPVNYNYARLAAGVSSMAEVCKGSRGSLLYQLLVLFFYPLVPLNDCSIINAKWKRNFFTVLCRMTRASLIDSGCALCSGIVFSKPMSKCHSTLFFIYFFSEKLTSIFEMLKCAEKRQGEWAVCAKVGSPSLEDRLNLPLSVDRTSHLMLISGSSK